MKRKTCESLIIAALLFSACAPVPVTSPSVVPSSTTRPTQSATPTISPQQPAPGEPAQEGKKYRNESFGLEFQFPEEWFGPQEYISDQTLRVEIGSDKVYPYGTGPEERIYEKIDTYSIIIQYTKGSTSPNQDEIYRMLAGMQVGEEVSNARSTTIKVRDVELGRFKGYETITTLSMTASMQPFYSREVTLIDNQSNLLTIFGNPNNVEIPPGEGWREIFESIDEENRVVFYKILETIIVE